MVAPLSCAGGLLQQPSAQRGGLRRRSRQLPCSTLRAGLLGWAAAAYSRSAGGLAVGAARCLQTGWRRMGEERSWRQAAHSAKHHQMQCATHRCKFVVCKQQEGSGQQARFTHLRLLPGRTLALCNTQPHTSDVQATTTKQTDRQANKQRKAATSKPIHTCDSCQAADSSGSMKPHTAGRAPAPRKQQDGSKLIHPPATPARPQTPRATRSGP